MEYLAKTTRLDDGRVEVEFPDCPGCQTFAEADEDVVAIAQEALEGWLEAHLLDGEAPPQPIAKRSVGALRVRVSPPVAIALQVRWRRQELKISQGELGRRLGVTRQQVALIERPTGNLRMSTLVKVAKALGATLDVELASS